MQGTSGNNDADGPGGVPGVDGLPVSLL